MSELKAYIGPAPDEKGLADYYLKSEADKVIAEKDEKIDIYKRGWEESDRINEHLYAQLRHSKYKRCLAMAEWCNANCMHTVLLIGHKIMPHWEWRIKTNYWYKWRKIWFELYKKFKEAK